MADVIKKELFTAKSFDKCGPVLCCVTSEQPLFIKSAEKKVGDARLLRTVITKFTASGMAVFETVV